MKVRSITFLTTDGDASNTGLIIIGLFAFSLVILTIGVGA